MNYTENIRQFREENPEFTYNEARALYKWLNKIDGFMFPDNKWKSYWVESEKEAYLFCTKEQLMDHVRREI